MPAIEPSRLKREASALGELFHTPEAFARELESLLEHYADRVRRPGQSGAPPPLLPAYNVSRPVLRQIMLRLSPLAAADPEGALVLAETLWSRDFLEYRIIGARLLGTINDVQPDQVLETIRRWADPALEAELHWVLFREAARSLWKFQPEAYFEMIESWLRDRDEKRRTLGLRALTAIVENPEFANLPRIFNLMTLATSQVTSNIRIPLLDLMSALAQTSPQETAYFLRQNVISEDPENAGWFIRQLRKYFSPSTQAKLRQQLRSQAEA